MKITLQKIENQKGQTLIFVLLVMTIALAVGIAISTRTLSTIRRTTNIDSSSRAQSAAEAAIEYYLTKTPSQLNVLAGYATVSTTPTDCTKISAVQAYPSSGSLASDVNTTADVTIQRYGCLASGGSTKYTINQDGILELKTDASSGSLNICWSPSNTSQNSALYIQEIYGASAPYQIKKVGYKLTVTDSPTNFKTAVSGCTSPAYSLAANSKLVRILSLYNGSEVTVTASGGSVQYQGFTIDAKGKVGGTTQQRKVTVAKSLPYLPNIFNFGIYSNTTSEGL